MFMDSNANANGKEHRSESIQMHHNICNEIAPENYYHATERLLICIATHVHPYLTIYDQIPS